LSPDDEIYLYNVYQMPDDCKFDEESNTLKYTERDKKWVVRYSLISHD